MAKIAAKHGVDIAAVAIKYVLNQPGVAAAIVGVRHGGHLSQHLAAATLASDATGLAALAKVMSQRRPTLGYIRSRLLLAGVDVNQTPNCGA